jgi:putative membrane protein
MRPLVLLAVLLLAACTAETDQRAHPQPPQEPPSPVLAPQDRDFLERAAKGSNAEVAMGLLVDSRSIRPDVIAFGHQMVGDHTAINRNLAAIATRYRIILPTSLGDHQASYDRVVDLYRDEFDREYVRVMIDDHDAAVQLFREEASGGADPALRAFAAQTLPLIQSHLQHAKGLKYSTPP